MYSLPPGERALADEEENALMRLCDFPEKSKSSLPGCADVRDGELPPKDLTLSDDMILWWLLREGEETAGELRISASDLNIPWLGEEKATFVLEREICFDRSRARCARSPVASIDLSQAFSAFCLVVLEGMFIGLKTAFPVRMTAMPCSAWA